ncbi:STAS domain-containing protein [Arundinibacter roseus]|uniref:STAS domain-containing protein n=1 Tax=Arundinibacter roseus TaxID=2070510 RepID=A0A4R4KK31_9BACT|nr:STAS domain-containing protein [Arundinibacter roseus]TDB66921.1 STAS domain-containing protein [Arundinibacter roseus]
MDYKIERSEQYAVITLKETAFAGEIPGLFEAQAREILREDTHNLIVVMNEATTVDAAGITTLRKMIRLCATSLGTLVLVTKNDDFMDLLEDSRIPDLVLLPTLEEAIDAVFMHDLENEFGAGDDDDYDADDYEGISESNEP